MLTLKIECDSVQVYIYIYYELYVKAYYDWPQQYTVAPAAFDTSKTKQNDKPPYLNVKTH